jgi:hypothetical protein
MSGFSEKVFEGAPTWFVSIMTGRKFKLHPLE